MVESLPAGRSAVFNLTVEGCPEFFANGVLVHNCRNMIVMAYSSLLSNAKSVQMGNYKSARQIDNSDEVIDVDAQIMAAERADAEANAV